MTHALLLFLFYFFAAISIYLGVISLRGGLRFARYVQGELSRDNVQFAPFVTVFVPLRGIDEGLRENIAAVLAQDYPNYEMIFVSDDEKDQAWPVVEDARRSFAGESGRAMQTIVAGRAADRGQKVHNLSVAVRHANMKSEVFVFVDSDARPGRDWLRWLVAPLQDQSIGAATGYRWFVPVRGGFASHLRSVWNAAIASALGADGKKNFCWGGATAIRRSTFEKCGVIDHWLGTVSDDFALTRAVHEAGLPITFVPRCLTPSLESCSLKELVEFTTRQLKITRAYAAHLWKAVLFGSVIFVITFFGGIVLVAARACLHLPIATPLVLLAILFAMGATKSHVRLRAVAAVINDATVISFASILAHICLWPVASALYLYNAVVAAVSRRIEWRGIIYELKSPNETVIIEKQKSQVRDQRSE